MGAKRMTMEVAWVATVLALGIHAFAQQTEVTRATGRQRNGLPPSVARTISEAARTTTVESSTSTGISMLGEGTSTPKTVHRGALSAGNQSRAIRDQLTEVVEVPGTDVLLGYRIGEARSWYEFRNGTLSWRDPAQGESNFIEVTVQDAADFRVFTNCKVSVSVKGSDGNELLSTTSLELIWGKEFFCYGRNVSLPEKITKAVLSVWIGPPEFARMDKELGAFFIAPVTYVWPNARISGRSGKGSRAEPEKVTFPEGRHPAATSTPYPGSQAPEVRDPMDSDQSAPLSAAETTRKQKGPSPRR